MKQTFSLSPLAATSRPGFRPFSTRLETLAPVVALARLYSNLLEEHTTPRRALRLLHVQVAFFCLFLFGNAHWTTGILLLAWALLALADCRRR